MARHDLLGLTADAVAALSNRGLVKRAQREIETGKGPELREEADGTVIATFEGVETRLEPGLALRDTKCSCAAVGMCRHRVAAALAYKSWYERQACGEEVAVQAAEAESEKAAWSPGAFDDDTLLATLGRSTLSRATRQRGRGYVAQVHRASRSEVPTVALSTCTVRFLVPNELSYARCDCKVGVQCEHVALAVWACRAADSRDPEASEVMVELSTTGGSESTAALAPKNLEVAVELAREVLLDGTVNTRTSTQAQFARVRKQLDEENILWPSTVVEDLEDQLAAYQARSARHRPRRVALLLTELAARRRASSNGKGAVPPRMILGMDEKAETKLDHLRLVSLGARLSADGDERLAEVLLADPDTATVLVLSKRWGAESGQKPEDGEVLGRRSLASGIRLCDLARGQMVTTVARRRANRSLLIGRGTIGRTAVMPQQGEWEHLPDALLHRNYFVLEQLLNQRAPILLRPRVLADNAFVVAVDSIREVLYSPGEQTLFATLVDAAGHTIELAREYRACAPGAMDSLSRALEGKLGKVRYVSGWVEHRREGLVMEPLAIQVDDRLIVPDLEPFTPDEALERRAFQAPAAPLRDAIALAIDTLDDGAHQGLRHAAPSYEQRLADCAARLAQVGLKPTGALVRAVRDRLAAARAGADQAAELALCQAWEDAQLRLWLARECV